MTYQMNKRVTVNYSLTPEVRSDVTPPTSSPVNLVAATVRVDTSKPVTSLQIRLADGTRYYQHNYMYCTCKPHCHDDVIIGTNVAQLLYYYAYMHTHTVVHTHTHCRTNTQTVME